MNAEEYGRMRSLEDEYWWFVSRRRLALELLAENAPSGPVLDVGCGTGALLEELQKTRDADGLDFSPLALDFARSRSLTGLFQGDAQCLPFATASYQAVVSLDTLEHVPDDKAAAAEMFRVLRPGGVVILNVPAFMWLWGPHDAALHHYRRYTSGQLREVLEEAGFQVELLSCGVFFLFPVVVLRRLLDKFKRGPAAVSLPTVPPVLNRALIALMKAEGRLMKKMPLPWGSSVTCVARKLS